MRVFVSEYVCGGAWPEESLDSSLAVEGRAMLLALIQDLLLIPNVDVVTTWDHRLGEFPLRNVPETTSRIGGILPPDWRWQDATGTKNRELASDTFLRSASTLSAEQISSRHDERKAFERLCEHSDAAFVIAPEFHNFLADRVKIASPRTRLLGCDFEATTLCSDKLRMATFLSEAGIPTISTEAFEPKASRPDSFQNDDTAFPCVIKPRDGAGSLLTCKVSDSAELVTLSKRLTAEGNDFSFVTQPFIEGVAISCAAIVTAAQGDDSGRLRIDVLPPCQQVLTDDGRFVYEGAEYPPPISTAVSEKVERLVQRCCSLIPGLSGYVGFDLLVPYTENADPIVIEINPRLTTGFLLWQKMCNDNLVARMLAATGDGEKIRRPLSWKSDPASIRLTSMSE